MSRRASPEETVSALGLLWWQEIEDAKRGNFAPLAAALRSDRAIPKAEWPQLRKLLADALDGKLKRPRGRAKAVPGDLRDAAERLRFAAMQVPRTKRALENDPEAEARSTARAIELTAAEYGVDEAKLGSLHRRSKKDRRRSPKS